MARLCHKDVAGGVMLCGTRFGQNLKCGRMAVPDCTKAKALTGIPPYKFPDGYYSTPLGRYAPARAANPDRAPRCELVLPGTKCAWLLEYGYPFIGDETISILHMQSE